LKPAQGEIRAGLLYDYQTNVASYPAWQAWLRQHRPPLPESVATGPKPKSGDVCYSVVKEGKADLTLTSCFGSDLPQADMRHCREGIIENNRHARRLFIFWAAYFVL
jgi:hypothetical protein